MSEYRGLPLLRVAACKRARFLIVAFAFAAAGRADLTAAGASVPAAPVKVNRTVPKVEPPKTALEFSTKPTVQEIFRARVFEEPLVPIGGEPSAGENAALAAALLGYAKRSGPDDFASLTGFLEQQPKSPWRGALLTCLGLEYYNTAHYSLALDAWEKAWAHAKDAKDAKGKAIADRAVGELAYMYARLGRMNELEALLKSVEGRPFVGAATERITGAREGLWNMQHKPEISFKCGPYALQRILFSNQSLLTSAATNALMEIFNFPSTQKGVSLPQVAELSKNLGLNYQMAFRGASSNRSSRREEAHSEKSEISQSLLTSAATSEGVKGDFLVPSVVHWKVGHYAAMVRQEGDKYLLEDPTFGNTVWATRQALEAETSGYFLIPSGELPRGWRSVDAKEGASVWGRGATAFNDPKPTGCKDGSSGGGKCGGGGCGPFGGPPPVSGPNGQGAPPSSNFEFPFLVSGMAVSRVHLMTVNLNIVDTPVGHSPPVGPPVLFTVRYSHRDAFQPANFAYANFGPKWTCDWISYITDNPTNTLADVNYYIMGGGTRTFTGFSTNTQTFAFQQLDQTLLKRTGPDSYEMLAGEGSKAIFSQPDGAIGNSRKIFLTQLLDPFGNAVTLTYDSNLRIVAISDAIGQVTTLTYGNTNDIYKITRVTDPFGRFADFAYDSLGRLTNITDVIGLTSRFVYEGSGDFINALITPYGTNTFTQGPALSNTRFLETVYPDGSRDRVEFNQQVVPGFSGNDPIVTIPLGMFAASGTGYVRNSYYWSRTACASGYGDYGKARNYHWLHGFGTSPIVESSKEALENRVWYNYPGQTDLNSTSEGTSSRPTKIGRVLEDGKTQLYTYAYNGFGHVTNSIDPVGRTFSYLYASDGIDLLEVRQTRAGNNELLFRATYNSQHRPLTTVGADGQTNTFTYNARGQLLAATNPKNETTTYAYDTNGYLTIVDGPLPGTNDMLTATYDSFGRTRTKTDLSGYALTFDYDALDRFTKITHPDSTFQQFTYDRLDVSVLRDRAGRQTLLEYDNVRQMKKKTDPLGRVTLFDWCRCGQIKSLTDPMGRTTSWLTDVQGRVTAKQYGDGSQATYLYENASSRLRQVIDEKQQVTQFTYNRDNTLKSTAYFNSAVPTPGVSYTYDPNYLRTLSMTDGVGTTLYSYNPVTTPPNLGANRLASVDGPLPNAPITYTYDELGRRVSSAINGVASSMAYDAGGRVLGETNALGTFTFDYDGATGRVLTNVFPNGLRIERGYGGILQDLELRRITHKAGATPISEFLYNRDLLANRITTWSQQIGAQPPDLHTFSYDAADQLLSATVTNAGTLVNTFAYTYDPAGNRLTEQIGSSNCTATYNALNQISTTTALGASRTNEWDAKDRLVAINAGNQRTEFNYDGLDRMVSIRQLTNGTEISLRRFIWCDGRICEERDTVGAVTKRFLPQGMKVETGPGTGSFYYTRDHLGSIRELTDAGGTVRARYSYDPWGRRTRLAGDMAADFGFTGSFHATEAGLVVSRFRVYDPESGRWLSRDPLPYAEVREGPNLYSYVRDNPLNRTDPLGLASPCCETEDILVRNIKYLATEVCYQEGHHADEECKDLFEHHVVDAFKKCKYDQELADKRCKALFDLVEIAEDLLADCEARPCFLPPKCPEPSPPVSNPDFQP